MTQFISVNAPKMMPKTLRSSSWALFDLHARKLLRFW